MSISPRDGYSDREEVYTRDSSEQRRRFLSVTRQPAPPSVARNILTSLSPWEKSAISLGAGVPPCVSPCLCVCVCTRMRTRITKVRDWRAEFRGALIDVTITAIYPSARLFLCDTATTTRTLPREGLHEGVGTSGGIVGCDLVSGCRRGATMAKYKSKSRPPSFLLSFRPYVAPLSSAFVYSASLRQHRHSFPSSFFSSCLSSCFSSFSSPFLVAGARGLYPRSRGHLSAPFSSWPPSRFLPLYAALVLSLCLPL